jgi:hypothetical protein
LKLDNYAVVKLITGEQLLCTLLNETDDGIVVLDPITVRMIPTVGGSLSEQAVTSLYCQFSDEKTFVFDYKNVIYCKDMASKLIPYYKKLVREFNDENRQTHEFYREEAKEDSIIMDNLMDTSKIH